MLINQNDIDSANATYVNQQNATIRKIGQTRLKALELFQTILSLLHPSLGVLAAAQVALLKGETKPEVEAVEHYEPIHMKNYLSKQLRRQLVRTVLLVIRNFSYCSIACQLCIMILDNIKTMFDVVDIVQLQKFVIQEFRDRHQHLYDQHTKNREQGNTTAVKRYQINHLNMQSA